jgi:glycosyltransferase involved in cell wall biosynthesis
VIDGETGVLEPTDDETALAAAVARVLGSPDYAAALARAGREHVAHAFGIECLVEDLHRLGRRKLDEH